MIVKFYNYILENKKTDNLYKLYIYKDLLEILNKPIFNDNKIAQEILENKIRTDIKYNFINIKNVSTNDDYISYLTIDKLKNILNTDDIKLKDIRYNFYNNLELQYHKYRQDIKIGKFIKLLFKDKYTDKEIEEFVNKYKSVFKSKNFIVVNGNDIKKYYNHNFYEKSEKGTLYTSCMRFDDCDKYLNIYSKNPEKVSLLIYKKNINNDIISGRAILWKLDKPNGVTFMDRIYFTDDYILDIFKEYAKEHGYYYKQFQSYDTYSPIICVNAKTCIKMDLSVKLNDIEYDYYPYMDTLKYYDINTKELSTYDIYNRNSYVIKLSSTSGYYYRVND